MSQTLTFSLQPVNADGEPLEDGTCTDNGRSPYNCISISGSDVTAYIKKQGQGIPYCFYLDPKCHIPENGVWNIISAVPGPYINVNGLSATGNIRADGLSYTPTTVYRTGIKCPILYPPASGSCKLRLKYSVNFPTPSDEALAYGDVIVTPTEGTAQFFNLFGSGYQDKWFDRYWNEGYYTWEPEIHILNAGEHEINLSDYIHDSTIYDVTVWFSIGGWESNQTCNFEIDIEYLTLCLS